MSAAQAPVLTSNSRNKISKNKLVNPLDQQQPHRPPDARALYAPPLVMCHALHAGSCQIDGLVEDELALAHGLYGGSVCVGFQQCVWLSSAWYD